MLSQPLTDENPHPTGTPATGQLAQALTRIRALPDPAARLRAARGLEAELLGLLEEVRTVVSQAAAVGHADHPVTLDERQQAPWD